MLPGQGLLGLGIPGGYPGSHDLLHMGRDLCLPSLPQSLLALPPFLLQGGKFRLPARTLRRQLLLLFPRVVHLLLIVKLQVQVQDGIQILCVQGIPLGLIGSAGLLPVFILLRPGFP